MPFGKHEGDFISYIFQNDPQYLYWLVTQQWMEEKFPRLLHQIEEILGIEQEEVKADLSRSVELVKERIFEALTYRGFLEGEAKQMIDRLINNYKPNIGGGEEK